MTLHWTPVLETKYMYLWLVERRYKASSVFICLGCGRNDAPFVYLVPRKKADRVKLVFMWYIQTATTEYLFSQQ